MTSAVPIADSPLPARRHLSRVRRPLGPLDWYLEADHLLAADQRLFQRQYRRFYYADIREIAIWPNRRLWLWLSLELTLGMVAAWLAWLVNLTRGADFILGVAVAFMVCDKALGHRASARIATDHSSYLAPMVGRWRRAAHVLEELERRLPPAATTIVEAP